MDELDEHTTWAIQRLYSRHEAGRRRAPELDVDAEMRREAAHRLHRAIGEMPRDTQIAALSLAFWLTTTTAPEATGAARVLLGRADETEDGA